MALLREGGGEGRGETAASRPQSRKGPMGAERSRERKGAGLCRGWSCRKERVALAQETGGSGCEGGREVWNYMWGQVRGFLFMKDPGCTDIDEEDVLEKGVLVRQEGVPGGRDGQRGWPSEVETREGGRAARSALGAGASGPGGFCVLPRAAMGWL